MKNVLVVDSDQVMLRTLTGLLKSQGGFLKVFSAATAKDSIRILKSTPVDMVICSVRLPKLSGFRLVARLAKEYPETKVIVMTRDASSLLRAAIRRYRSAVHLDQSHDISMLTKRVFTELQIDYGGGIRGINLSSFLQMMELESCSCRLGITSKDLSGTLWLKNGELIAAQCRAAAGKEAALEILAWKNVHIEIDYNPREVEQQIATPLMMLILESSQRYDEIRGCAADHRAHERYDLLVALEYDIRDMTRQCLLRDISLGGAYIETDQEMEPGQKITLTLTSVSLKSSCSIDAEVVHGDTRGAGFRFLINSLEQRRMIKAMIDGSVNSRQPAEQEELSPVQVV